MRHLQTLWIRRLLPGSRRNIACVIASALLVLGLAGSLSPAASSTSASPGIVPVDTFSRAPDDIRSRLVAEGWTLPSLADWDVKRFGGVQSDRIWSAGTAIIVPEARQLWQLYISATAPIRTLAVIRDLDSLAIKKTLVLPFQVRRSHSNAAEGGTWTYVLDGGRRLFLATQEPAPVNYYVFDLGTFAMTRLAPPPAVRSGYQLAALSYDPVAAGLLAVYSGQDNLLVSIPMTPAPAGGSGGLAEAVINAPSDAQASATQLTRRLRSCDGTMPQPGNSTYLATFLPLQDRVVVACHRSGSVGAVVAVPRATLWDAAGPEQVVVGPVALETMLADPGSERIHLMTTVGEIWVFDAKAMAFVGVISASARVQSRIVLGYGLDPSTGRLFFISPTYGLGVAEGRYFPIPQARTLESAKTEANEMILSDPDTGRVFLMAGYKQNKAQEYTIYQVGTAPVPPPPPDPDRNTADLPEKEGVTESRFFANASGYGIRIQLAKGVVGAAPSPSVGVNSPIAQVFADFVNSRCGYTDRDMAAARVSKAEYDTGSTAANAVSIEADDRTKQDLLNRSRCDVEGKGPSGTVFQGIFGTAPPGSLSLLDSGDGWDRTASECSASAGDDVERKTDNSGEEAGYSEVTCPKPGGELVAIARAELDGSGLSVGKTSTEVRINRGPKGVVSTVTAVAEDIRIAEGAIEIGEIRSQATSTSNGRPSPDALSKHSVFFKGVKVAGQPVCFSSCPVQLVVDALNTAANGRAQFRVADGLDERLLRGTPRGALTAVQKAAGRQASDRALTGDFTTEVPGLEMIVYNDNVKSGRARQLYQFTGVASAATYNIASIPNFSGDGPSVDDEPFDADVTVDRDGGGTVGGSPGDGPGTPSIRGVPASSGSPEKGGIRRVIEAIGRGLRLFFSSPRHAALIGTAWGLLFLPALISRRRRLLIAARAT